MRHDYPQVVMSTTAPNRTNMEEHLAAIDSHLKDVRQDVSEILRLLQDELKAFREREFWRDYSETYHQE